jgi:signal transduction histidine kinase
MTAGAASPASLASRVLRLAADLPSTGPRSGDLTPVVELIGEGLGAMRVTVRMSGDAGAHDHDWSAPGMRRRSATGDVQTTARPIRHRGAQVGELLVGMPSDPVPPPDLKQQVGQVAAVLGIVVAGSGAAALARAARDRAQATRERIADARHRAASEMESERYALERDLHDGVQHHLVSLQMAAAVLEYQMELGSADPRTLENAVADLGRSLDRTHRLLMDTATGVAPTPLRTAGLAGALALSLHDARNVTLAVSPDVRSRRYPPIVEIAVYFTCLEAVSNAQKHAPGAKITVTVRNTYHGLWFAVADTGPGLDEADGAGLGSLRARLASAGGTMDITSGAGSGTEIIGIVPI